MQLNFEIINNEVGTGNYPDLIHFANTQAQVFSITDGELYATATNKIHYGLWENATFQEEIEASPDEDMTHFELKILQGFGIVGGYKTGNTHKLIIYEFAFEMDRYLNSGSIKHNIESPVSSFALNLENPLSENPEHPGNVAVNEENSLLSPGAKVKFFFGAGDDYPEYEMGVFYVDRSNFTLLSETATADGRNSIGKTLKDQSVDEVNEYWYDFINKHIETLFEHAHLESDFYLVEQTEQKGWFAFSPNINYEKALNTMLEVLPQWKVRELSDGTIVVGNDSYSEFTPSGMYVFYRNKDIFSRQIVRDDAEAYNRVCVHTQNYAKAVYRNVESFQSWNLQANKTLYVQVADGLMFADLENYADELALRLEGVGKLESFVGPFRPHLQVGDEAVITDESDSKSLGLITEITHNFGKSGFYTDFTVDSGGTVGKGRLSDFISIIAVGAMSQKVNVGWDDIDMSAYINLSRYAEVTASSQFKDWCSPELMKDGKKYADDGAGDELGDSGWMPADEDENPFFIFRFNQRCLINKIMLWLAYDGDYAEDYLPEEYRIQYWNGAFWVDLLEVEYVDVEMVHNFDAIETSAVKFITKHKDGDQYWREVEIWGNM